MKYIGLLFICFCSFLSQAQVSADSAKVHHLSHTAVMVLRLNDATKELIVQFDDESRIDLKTFLKLDMSASYPNDPKIIKCIIEGILYMESRGYKLITSYSFHPGGSSFQVQYIFVQEN